jgi:hypothetical protein
MCIENSGSSGVKLRWTPTPKVVVSLMVGIIKRGIFLNIFYVLYSTLLPLPPLRSDSIVPTDAGIEPRTVATGALAVRRYNN